ncbi:MAG: hypothetical protein BWY79_01853 [Actinobacteria bacterium ADurb.Bin444]|nr:MAG: hypothetical protein BWY79_01853 [Actinobacteria bacterium ADurb.Bin444]
MAERSSRWRRIRQALGGESQLGSAIAHLSRERETQVLQQLDEFSKQVVVVVENLHEMVRRFAAGATTELHAAAMEIDRLESKADVLKAEMLDRLSMGGLFFMATADVSRLVTSMDKIANLAVGAADRIAMRPLDLPQPFKDNIVRLARIDTQATARLCDAVLALSRDLRDAFALSKQVAKLESEADAVFKESYLMLLDMDIDYKTFLQANAIIDRLESIADTCHQNAELLRHLILEYIG